MTASDEKSASGDGAADQPAAFESESRIAAALAFHRQGRIQDAAIIYAEILKYDPGHADALHFLGFAYYQMGRHQDALHYLDAALRIKLDPAPLSDRGHVLAAMGRGDEAIASFDQAIALQPDVRDAFNGRGVVLTNVRRFHEALASFDRAIVIDPTYVEAHSNRGIVLSHLGRHDEALDSLDRAIALNPNYAVAFFNRGNTFRELGRYDEASASYCAATALHPEFAEAHWSEATLRLYRGDFEMGWRKFEWRHHVSGRQHFIRDFAAPPWTGAENITGKTVLLYAEQGFGDTIQFCRYAKLVAARGAKVVLETPKALVSLLRDLEGVDLTIEEGQPLPPFDYHCPLLSLPLRFQTRLETIPAASPYLVAEPDKVVGLGDVVGPGVQPRAGLVWAGNAAHNNNRNRSMPFASLLKAMPHGIQPISLQKDIREDDLAHLRADRTVIDGAEFLHDFSDTAALISLLDIVISVDTAVAHLAAALGKPTWLLLPHTPDWRWLMDRHDTPWYPTMRLFRQPTPGDWGSVVDMVRGELQAALDTGLFA